MASISHDDAYLAQLRSHIKPPETLQRYGYVMKPLTNSELLLKRRCLGCRKTVSKYESQEHRKALARSSQTVEKIKEGSRMSATGAALATAVDSAADHAANLNSEKPPAMICRFHRGYHACGKPTKAQACSGSPVHSPETTPLHRLRQQYQYHSTPCRSAGEVSFRSAVALDCEMGVTVSGDSEVIRITLIDYFSGETLVDNIVRPDKRLEHLNTRYSGITWSDFNKAIRQRTALHEKSGARRAIWQFVGPETVVVGHAAFNDLRALRWIHPAVVDSYIIETEFRARMEALKEAELAAVGKKNGELETTLKEWETAIIGVNELGADAQSKAAEEAPVENPKSKRPGNLSLKALAKKCLGKDIQVGRKGHDSLEDAFAARDLVHWYLSNPNQDMW